MKTAKLGRIDASDTHHVLAHEAAPTPTTTSVSKTSVLVGLRFLAATFTFAYSATALIRSYYSSTTAHTALVLGASLLWCCGLAVGLTALPAAGTHAIVTDFERGPTGC